VNEFIALISSGEGENKRSALSVSIERKSSSNERMACLISEFGSFKVANMIAKGRIYMICTIDLQKSRDFTVTQVTLFFIFRI